MKTLFKRGLPFLLTLALLVSLLSGLTLNVSAATYVYNWGERGELATELSASAEAWYGSTTYAQLSALSGSSSTSSVPYSALYEQLADMMTDAHDSPTSYDGTKELYRYTDCENGGGSISSFYSGTAIGPEWDGGDTWNREHVWPNSKSDSGSGSSTSREADIMMLRPTAVSENSGRGNAAYGEGSSYYHPNEESGGAYDLRGDVARVVLYVYVRYGTSSNSDGALDYMWGASGVIESKEVLLQWMEEDPVDTWELGRNDSVQSITGTRNVFVDYPELAFLLFDADIPAGYDSPSGEGAGSAYSITASSNNTSYGTVSLSGRTITATPKTGYYAAGYTVTSGTATVTQDGNTFTVDASTDCTVRINFAAKTAATVTFMEDGAVGSTVNTYLGDPITLPSPSNAAPLNHTFVGWVTAAVKDVTEKPTVLAVGSEQTVSATTYYALYSYEEGTGGSGGISGTETLNIFGTTGTKSGDSETITWTGENFTFVNNKANSSTAIRTSDTDHYRVYAKSQIVITPADGRTITQIVITATGSSYVSGFTSSITNGTGSHSGTTVTIIPTDGTTAVMLTPSAQCRLKTIEVTYGGGGATTTYYTTSTCAHANTSVIPAVDATCTTAGNTAGVHCNDCGLDISGNEVIAAFGHNYVAGETIDPTETEDGYTVYTCERCDDTYNGDIVPALGVAYTVSFRVPTGVAAIGSMSCANAGITLPTAGVPTGAYDYTFIGWVEATVDNSTVAPIIYKPNTNFTTKKNIELIALYTYSIGSSGGDTWIQVTDPSVLTAGTQLIIADSKAADGTTYTTGEMHSNGYLTTVTGSVFTADMSVLNTVADGTVIFTLGGSDGAWTLTCEAGLLHATSGLKLSFDSGVSTWTITAEGDAEGSMIIASTGGADYGMLQFNASSPRFKTYKTTSNQSNPRLYMPQGGSGTLYYTTEITEAAEENYLLSYRVPNGVTQPESAIGNSIVTLETPVENTVTIGSVVYTFVGWVKENCEESTEVPDEVYAAGTEYPLTANTVLYALYTYDVTTEVSGGTGEYVLTDLADITSDDIVVITMKTSNGNIYALTSSNGSSAAPTATEVSVSNNKLSADPSDALKWNIGGTTDAYVLYPNGTTTTWLYSTTSNNGIRVGTGSAKTFKISSGYLYNITQGRYVGVYNNADWRSYTSIHANIANETLGFYVYQEGGATTTTTTYYTTAISSVADLTGATVTLGDTLGLNFHTLLSNQYANATSVTFTYYDERQNAYDNETVNIADDLYSDAYSAYLFTLDLPASYMATTVEAVLYYGGEILDIQVYSIREYAKAIIDGSYTDKQKAAVKAMLNYGAWAQNYFGYNTGDLANNVLNAGDQLTDTAAALSQVENIAQYKATVTNKLDSFIGYTLLLKDVTGLRLYFSEQVTVMVDGVAKTAEVDSQNNSRYYVEIEGVNADELDTTMEITCGDMTISNLSVLSPAAIVAQNTGKSENFRNAMIALILYAQSVNDMLTEG